MFQQFARISLALILLCGFSSAGRSDVRAAPTLPFEIQDYHFASGSTELAGRLFVPRNRKQFPLVILVQGSDYDDANHSAYWRLLADTLARSGIGAFSFNKRGVAGSTGKQTDDPDVQSDDVAAACRFASRLHGIDQSNVGYYGISQAGWIVPRALQKCRGSFTILTSPAGVSAMEQIDYYLQGQYHAVGMTPAESTSAQRLHDALADYYRTGSNYAQIQALVDRNVRTPWFGKFEKIAFRTDVPASHRLPTPAELESAVRRDPSQYEIYRDEHNWEEGRSLYRHISVPVLFVYGGQDELVPVNRSMQIFQDAMKAAANPDVTFHIFETADHSIQLGQHVLPGYREYLAKWILQHAKN